MAQSHPQPLCEVPLQNPQREAFAQAIARGETPSEAFRIVYGGDARGRGARSAQQVSLPDVRARVRYLRPDLTFASDNTAITPDDSDKTPGLPTIAYTAWLARQFCARLVETRRPLRAICSEPGMPDLRSLLRWLDTEPRFRTQYARARALQAELIADDIVEIADDTAEDFKEDAHGKLRVDGEAIQRSKLRVDTRKWLVAKLLPKKYGDKAEDASASSVPEKGKEEGIQYRLTEERRAALMERRRQIIEASKNRRSAP